MLVLRALLARDNVMNIRAARNHDYVLGSTRDYVFPSVPSDFTVAASGTTQPALWRDDLYSVYLGPRAVVLTAAMTHDP